MHASPTDDGSLVRMCSAADRSGTSIIVILPPANDSGTVRSITIASRFNLEAMSSRSASTEPNGTASTTVSALDAADALSATSIAFDEDEIGNVARARG